ncbi:hypothetical protein RBB79_02150 [Tunturiibacter empetritectus]|uniref:Uncharacterized protein n=2 Tax=Tunturiibacter TaxID=3154218 RepID=A0A852V5J7_9BACT|nr:hypothetical protein [Edaphobacter lichenicola]NYF88298.1 hypothetical protein [Edaphobacter lichenicola]
MIEHIGEGALEAARNDPACFVRGFDLMTIDEVQKAFKVLRVLKAIENTESRRISRKQAYA